MDLRVEHTQIPMFSLAARQTVQQPFRADFVVPDTMPDAAEIVQSEGDLCLWRLDVCDGCAELEGELALRICCLPEEGGAPFGVPADVPVRITMRTEEIARGMQPVISCRPAEVNVVLLHSRKLRVQGTVDCELALYRADALRVTTSLGDGEPGLFTRRTAVRIPIVTDVLEQVFTVAETLPLRAGFPQDGRLLTHRSELLPAEPAAENGRVILGGRIRTEATYADAQSGLTVSETLETPFSQLLDLQTGECAPSCAEATLHLTSVELHVRTDEQAIDAEYHVVAQVLCRAEVPAELLTDAYSVHGALTPEWGEIALGEGGTVRQIVSAELEDDRPDRSEASVTLVRRTEQADLWALAKAYSSSEDAIRAANPETEPPSKWLLIPRLG